MTDAPVPVEVIPGATPETLLVRPTRGDERRRVYAALNAVPHECRLRLGAEGVAIDAFEAEAVLAACRGRLRPRLDVQAERILHNRRHIAQHNATLRQQIQRITGAGRAAAEDQLPDNPDLQVLDDHQWVNVACMTLPDGHGLCVFDEQGAGKTVTGIFAYDTLVQRDECDVALIVAPKSMVAEWPSDFARFTDDRYAVQIIGGNRRTKREKLAAGGDVFVTNYETVVQLEEELRALLRRYGDRAIMVVDESFYVKNFDAQRTRALRNLREWCGRAFVLCGTPAPNDARDVVQQFGLVDFGYSFRGVEVPDDRSLARPVIESVLDTRAAYVRHRKVEVLPELPPKRFNVVELELGPVQADLYREAQRGLVRDLRATDDRSFDRQLANFLARRSALLQICSNPVSVAEGYQETPAKLHGLDALLRSLIAERGEKVVVWSFYTASIDALVRRFRTYRPLRYDGTVADVAERRDAVSRFQNDDHSMLLVANPAAAGAGLTLHRARHAVYESMSNQAAHYLQSLDRIHRRGQTRDVEYTVLICRDTIEGAEYRRLRDKERAAANLLGDPSDGSITRQMMLAELLASDARPVVDGEVTA